MKIDSGKRFFVEVVYGQLCRIIEFTPTPLGTVWRVIVPLSNAAVEELLAKGDYDERLGAFPGSSPGRGLIMAMIAIAKDIQGSQDWKTYVDGAAFAWSRRTGEWLPTGRATSWKGPIMESNVTNGAFYVEVNYGQSRRIIEFTPTPAGVIWRMIRPLSHAPIDQLLAKDDYDEKRDPVLADSSGGGLMEALLSVVEDIRSSKDWQKYFEDALYVWDDGVGDWLPQERRRFYDRGNRVTCALTGLRHPGECC
jgi:hypothetical protein